jgi:hypothetical protein
LARSGSKFYHGIQTKFAEDSVAVFFKEPSPRFHQFYDKQNINQIIDNTPVNVFQLSLGVRVLVGSEPGSVVLGTVMGEYLNENNNSSNDNNNYDHERLVNLTIRLDKTGHDVSVANKTIWLLPVQMEDKGDMTILFLKIEWESGGIVVTGFNFAMCNCLIVILPPSRSRRLLPV